MKVLSKKEHILSVAEELFAETGYDGTSVRTIAAKAKVNIAMISYYFGSKEKLFSELVEYRASYLRLKLQDIQKENLEPMKQLEQVVDIYIDRIMSHQKFHRIIHRQLSLQNNEMNDYILNVLMKHVDEMKKIIEDGIRKKVFRNVDIDFLILSFFGTTAQCSNSSAFSKRILGIKPSCFISEDAKTIQRMKNYLIDLLKKYLVITNDN